MGNKIDLENRVISKEEGLKYAKERNIKYFETSAKTGYGINELFNEMYNDLYELHKHQILPYNINIDNNNKEEKNNKEKKKDKEKKEDKKYKNNKEVEKNKENEKNNISIYNNKQKLNKKTLEIEKSFVFKNLNKFISY